MKLTQFAPIILPIGLLFSACATTQKPEAHVKEKKEHVLHGQPHRKFGSKALRSRLLLRPKLKTNCFLFFGVRSGVLPAMN